MDEDLGLAERVGQLDRAAAPGERLVVDSASMASWDRSL